MKLVGKLWSLLREPQKAYYLGKALTRGCIYLVYYRLTKRRVIIRFPFLAFYQVRISGPGSVLIEKNCSVYPSCFNGLTIVTLSKDAKVKIGKNCSIGGLTIRCLKSIEVGPMNMFGNVLLQDCFFVESGKVKSKNERDRKDWCAPISIGENSWICAGACILSGSTIGKDCVIGAGSLCYNLGVSEYRFGIGNPVTKTIPINRIVNWFLESR